VLAVVMVARQQGQGNARFGELGGKALVFDGAAPIHQIAADQQQVGPGLQGDQAGQGVLQGRSRIHPAVE